MSPDSAGPVTIPVGLPGREYGVTVGVGAIERLPDLLRGRGRAMFVTQTAIMLPHVANVIDLFERRGNEHLVVGGVEHVDDGEAAKSLGTVERLCRRFAQLGVRRNDVVVAIGGGIVGDTAGFAAAVYHRGIAVVQVPTTLLAMVDSAIGGKTGVNLPEGKNLVGAFHQPIAVLADPTVLGTLPAREFDAGLGEVAKYAFLGDDELCTILETESAAVVARDPETVTRVVARCAAFKARVVVEDEHETRGTRATLNLGHTLAHALETAGGYGLLHGEAVAIGLVFAARLAAAMERIHPEQADAQIALLAALGLQTRVPADAPLDRSELLALMRRDKKSSGRLTFVLDGPEGVELVDDPPTVALDAAFAAVGIRA